MNLRELAPLGFLPWKWRVAITGALIVGLAIWMALGALGANAQQLDPLATVQAYTTADPNNPDRFGLATPDGRYSVTPVQGCDWLAAGQDVTTYPNWNIPPWLSIGAAGREADCIVRVEGRMDPTPCFTDDSGVCDVTAETDATD